MRGFSTSFPRGGAGVGLLLLRLAVALQLLSETLSPVAAPWWRAALPDGPAALLSVLLAVLLVLGMLTPVAGAIASLSQLFCLGQVGWEQASPCIVGAFTAAALVLLGPGAYAADARLFGRRRLVLPASTADHNRF